MRMFFSWMLTLLAGFTAFIGLTLLTLLPIQAAHNRELHERVKLAAAYQAKEGHLPQRYQYNPEKSGIGSMWVDKLDTCDPSFVPPSSDQFVIGFWQGDWWQCYGYPSGFTTLHTSVAGFLASEAGLEILINGFVAAAAFWCAVRLRQGANRQDMRPLAKAAWFGCFMIAMELFYGALDSTDDQFVYVPGYLKWFVKVYEATIFPIEQLAMAPIFKPFDNYIDINLFIIIEFLFWTISAYLIWCIYHLTNRAIRGNRQAQ